MICVVPNQNRAKATETAARGWGGEEREAQHAGASKEKGLVHRAGCKLARAGLAPFMSAKGSAYITVFFVLPVLNMTNIPAQCAAGQR